MLIGATVAINLAYFWINCPIDLSGDEAQYWDWSRRLQLSYYSKGPAIAYIIRGATAILGDTMPAVRTPAVLLFGVTLVGIYAIAARLFRDERVALWSVMLCLLSPIMIYLSGAMTIDAPMIACWTWATYFAVRALFDSSSNQRQSVMISWVCVGVIVGVGFLSKYSLLLWFVGLAVFLVLDGRSKREWIGAIASFLIALLFTAPVIIWNNANGWVGFRHVARQTGADGGRFNLGNVAEMVGGQIGVLGPTIVVLLIGALLWIRKLRRDREEASHDTRHRALIFLICIGAPFWLLTFLVSFIAKVQVNWPGPAYVTLLIVAAAFIVDRSSRAESWRRWRGVVWLTVIIGVGANIIMRDTSLLIPPLRMIGVPDQTAAKVDGLSRLRGWEELGQLVGEEQRKLGDGAFIFCDHYQQTAAMAFYVASRPRTFHAGTYFTKPQRMNQYSLWDDMRLDQPKLIGRNAIYLAKEGPLPDPLPAAFERVEKLPEIPVIKRGVQVATFRLWRCYNFKGLTPPNRAEKF